MAPCFLLEIATMDSAIETEESECQQASCGGKLGLHNLRISSTCNCAKPSRAVSFPLIVTTLDA